MPAGSGVRRRWKQPIAIDNGPLAIEDATTEQQQQLQADQQGKKMAKKEKDTLFAKLKLNKTRFNSTMSLVGEARH